MSGTSQTPVHVVMSVDPERLGAVTPLAVDAGLQVDGEMPAVGVLSGWVLPERVSALAAIDGVEAVEPERTVALPPPESPLQ